MRPFPLFLEFGAAEARATCNVTNHQPHDGHNVVLPATSVKGKGNDSFQNGRLHWGKRHAVPSRDLPPLRSADFVGREGKSMAEDGIYHGPTLYDLTKAGLA